MVSSRDVFVTQIEYYLPTLETRAQDFNFLENEFAHILKVLDWLSGLKEKEMSHNLPRLLESLSPYMEARSLSNTTVKYIEPCLLAAEVNGINPVNVYLMAYRAYWSTGQWGKAKEFIEQAVESGKTAPPSFYATALRFLGSLQINRGDYQTALSTLAKSRRLYQELGDRQGEISTIAEEAAYYLDKDDYSTADRYYSQVAEFEKSTLGEPSNHTLLMLGVVYRRLHRLTEAQDCFEEIVRRSDQAKTRSDRATALHHIAWVLIDLHQFAEAQQKAAEAKTIYGTIQDNRGSSDADEQLGEIAFYLHQYASCETSYLSCAALRKALNNKPGYASITRRLSKLYAVQDKKMLALKFLVISSFTYLSIGNLTPARLKRFFVDPIFKVKGMQSEPK